jgi:hypothetical protein
MEMKDLLVVANRNRELLLARARNGEIKGVNAKTIKALERPVTRLMRPINDEPLDDEGHRLVRIHIWGHGFTKVAVCKEVLPERKAMI